MEGAADWSDVWGVRTLESARGLPLYLSKWDGRIVCVPNEKKELNDFFLVHYAQTEHITRTHI